MLTVSPFGIALDLSRSRSTSRKGIKDILDMRMIVEKGNRSRAKCLGVYFASSRNNPTAIQTNFLPLIALKDSARRAVSPNVAVNIPASRARACRLEISRKPRDCGRRVAPLRNTDALYNARRCRRAKSRINPHVLMHQRGVYARCAGTPDVRRKGR